MISLVVASWLVLHWTSDSGPSVRKGRAVRKHRSMSQFRPYLDSLEQSQNRFVERVTGFEISIKIGKNQRRILTAVEPFPQGCIHRIETNRPRENGRQCSPQHAGALYVGNLPLLEEPLADELTPEGGLDEALHFVHGVIGEPTLLFRERNEVSAGVGGVLVERDFDNAERVVGIRSELIADESQGLSDTGIEGFKIKSMAGMELVSYTHALDFDFTFGIASGADEGL